MPFSRILWHCCLGKNNRLIVDLYKVSEDLRMRLNRGHPCVSVLNAPPVTRLDQFASGPSRGGMGQMPKGPVICRGPGRVRKMLSYAILFIMDTLKAARGECRRNCLFF